MPRELYLDKMEDDADRLRIEREKLFTEKISKHMAKSIKAIKTKEIKNENN